MRHRDEVIARCCCGDWRAGGPHLDTTETPIGTNKQLLLRAARSARYMCPGSSICMAGTAITSGHSYRTGYLHLLARLRVQTPVTTSQRSCTAREAIRHTRGTTTDIIEARTIGIAARMLQIDCSRSSARPHELEPTNGQSQQQWRFRHIAQGG